MSNQTISYTSTPIKREPFRQRSNSKSKAPKATNRKSHQLSNNGILSMETSSSAKIEIYDRKNNICLHKNQKYNNQNNFAMS